MRIGLLYHARFRHGSIGLCYHFMDDAIDIEKEVVLRSSHHLHNRDVALCTGDYSQWI